MAATIAIGFFGYTMIMANQTETVALSQSVSLEVPTGKGITTEYINDTKILHVTNGDGVSIMSYNSIETDLGSIFGFGAVKQLMTNGTENEVYQTTINGTTVWSIATGNNTTHDNIIISTHDKDLTLKIYESIKYNKTSIVENISNDTTRISDVNTQSNNVNTQSSNVNSASNANSESGAGSDNSQPYGLTRSSIREAPDGSGNQERLNKETGQWETI